jgi:hypothetical protein
MCQSSSLKSTVVSHYLQKIFTFKLKTYSIEHIYNAIKYLQYSYMQASFSPGFVQQIMPYLLVT